MPKAKGNPDYILGGKLNPFTSVTDRDLAIPAGTARRECYMVNPFVSLGVGVYGLVKFIDTGTTWKLADDQVLADFRNFDGTPILDMTAAALSVGTLTELWSSPILPNWMFDSKISLFAEVGRRDPSSTANARLMVGIRATTLPDSVYNNILGNHSSCDTVYRGCSSLGNSARCVLGALKGMEGSSQSAMGGQDFTIGSYVEGQTRARIAFSPGATTNEIRAYYLTIKTGPC